MSDYTYGSYTTYMPPFFGDPNLYQRQIFNGDGGTIIDPINGIVPRIWDDDTFDPSETVIIDTSPTSTATLAYEGTVDFGGTLHPVFEDAIGNYYVFSQDTVALPFNLDVNAINDNDSYAFPNCFAGGTLIETCDGDRRVEELAIGDLVVTADGRAVPVKWIGRQSMLSVFAREGRLPVKIKAGALGGGLPRRDLIVTADHGMILCGLIVNAGVLVNGHTIKTATLAELPQQITYYHVETEDHDVILAEGAPAETFIDYASRAAFDNFAEYIEIYGQERTIRELSRPRISSARMLPAGLLESMGLPQTQTYDVASSRVA